MKVAFILWLIYHHNREKLLMFDQDHNKADEKTIEIESLPLKCYWFVIWLFIHSKQLFSKILDIGTSDDFDFTTDSLLFRNIKGSETFDLYSIKTSIVFLLEFQNLINFLKQLTVFTPASIKPTWK